VIVDPVSLFYNNFFGWLVCWCVWISTPFLTFDDWLCIALAFFWFSLV
jgi:hypothetical protein